MYNNAKTGRM